MKWNLEHVKVEWRAKSKTERFYMVAGTIMLVLAMIGVLLPIVPQVPFAIVSAFLFSRGSTKIHHWMRHNKYFGEPVRDWEDHRVLRPKLKALSIGAMVAGALFAHWQLPFKWALCIDGVFILSSLFILSRRSNQG